MKKSYALLLLVLVLSCKKREEILEIPRANPTSLRVAEIIDTGSTDRRHIKYFYDKLGRVYHMQYVRRDYNRDFFYSFKGNKLSNIRITRPNETYLYLLSRNEKGLITSVKRSYNEFPDEMIINFRYDKNGNLTSHAFATSEEDTTSRYAVTYSDFINGRWTISREPLYITSSGIERREENVYRRKLDDEGRPIMFESTRIMDSLQDNEVYGLYQEVQYFDTGLLDKELKENRKAMIQTFYSSNLDVYDLLTNLIEGKPSSLGELPNEDEFNYIKTIIRYSAARFDFDSKIMQRNLEGLPTQIETTPHTNSGYEAPAKSTKIIRYEID